jgi:hypothetical protein
VFRSRRFINDIQDDLVLPPVKQLWARIEQSFVVREEDGTQQMFSFYKTTSAYELSCSGVVSLERSITQVHFGFKLRYARTKQNLRRLLHYGLLVLR